MQIIIAKSHFSSKVHSPEKPYTIQCIDRHRTCNQKIKQEDDGADIKSPFQKFPFFSFFHKPNKWNEKRLSSNDSLDNCRAHFWLKTWEKKKYRRNFIFDWKIIFFSVACIDGVSDEKEAKRRFLFHLKNSISIFLSQSINWWTLLNGISDDCLLGSKYSRKSNCY